MFRQKYCLTVIHRPFKGTAVTRWAFDN